VYWLLSILGIILLIGILHSVESGKETGGTKVIFPVKGTITKCPLNVKDAVLECHSGLNSVTELPDSEYNSRIREILNTDGTYIIRVSKPLR
jgi:hypothetical protein